MYYGHGLTIRACFTLWNVAGGDEHEAAAVPEVHRPGDHADHGAAGQAERDRPPPLPRLRVERQVADSTVRNHTRLAPSGTLGSGFYSAKPYAFGSEWNAR